MKILNAGQIQQWDTYTIEHEQMASIDLMERAAKCCTDWLIEKEFSEGPIKIFCGKGNNGGDGLAIARQLIEAGYHPQIYIVELGIKGTTDFQINLSRLHALTADIFFLQSAEFFPTISPDDIVIDALFGSGLNRPLKDLYADVVQYINDNAKTVISIDVPSGMFLDKSSKRNVVIRAHFTLTFECLKLCFLVAENGLNCGNVVVLKIGLHKEYLSTIDAVFNLTTFDFVKNIYQPRKKFSHKGTYGHALLVAGNKGKMGAAVLCARACLRTGVGLLTCAIPEDEFVVMQTALPEAMATPRNEVDIKKYSVTGIGPGIGADEESVDLVHSVIRSSKKQMVIDADGLNILSKNTAWLKLVDKGVLTPHPKEFERLFGEYDNDFDRLYKAIDLSKEYPFVIVLKGHYTLIAFKGKGYFNTTGNAGMAKGGSGDVLTGIITSLISQGYEEFEASVLGVYLHGLAGDLSLKKQSVESMLATDLIENIGPAFKVIAD